MNAASAGNDGGGSSSSPGISLLEWGDDAFARAREEGKPILLSITASWCHWCHVMDAEVLADAEMASFIEHNFVPVRVDSDRRPDVNSRYNQGGWPTICFLDEEGEIIAGTTFLPAVELRRLLIDVLTVLARDRERIDRALTEVRTRREEAASRRGVAVDPSLVEATMEVAERAYDAENGGFGTEPKFPYAGVLAFLLARLAAGAEGSEGEILRKTLEAMAAGGIHDREEGGFFRYATAADWSRPHYEKMLEDNAALLAVYTEAYRLSGEEDYAAVARDIHGYLAGTLRDADTGAFYGSQCADEDYYRLEAAARREREAPPVDRSFYAGWNAQAASALLKAFQVFGDEDYLEQGLAALEFVWEHLWDPELGAHHCQADGSVLLPGLLVDTAPLVGALLDAYECGAGDAWLTRSTQVARWLLSRLEDSELGGFHDCARPPAASGYPAERTVPPVDNSIAAAALIRLAQNTGQKEFEEAARRALERLSASFGQLGLFGAPFALALMRLFDPPVRVTIVGPPGEAGTVELIRQAHGARIPFRSIEVLDPAVHGEELDAVGYGYDGKPTAYVCIGASCQPPVDDPAQLVPRLESGWDAIRLQWPPR